jgi:hypothetical protein
VLASFAIALAWLRQRAGIALPSHWHGFASALASFAIALAWLRQRVGELRHPTGERDRRDHVVRKLSRTRCAFTKS